MHIGILSLQGDIEEHELALKRLQKESIRIKNLEDLEDLTHLIIPGGESTTMSLFLKDSPLKAAIQQKVQSGELKVFGTCAGAILLAKKVDPPEKVEHMDLMDVDISRNAYGTQMDSFETEIEFLPQKKKIHAVFIRAPKVTGVGESVKILAKDGENPVLLKQGNILLSTFHPEYLEDPVIHEYFLGME